MPGEPSRRLKWLIEPVGCRAFLSDFYERAPLVINRKQPGYFAGLLSLEEIDCLLAEHDLSWPQFAFADAREAAVRSNGGDRAENAPREFAAGRSIVLSGMQRHVSALAALCRGLEVEFSAAFQANVYITPAHSQGFKAHYDTHDVFKIGRAHV